MCSRGGTAYMHYDFFFFFQAEDGIRDVAVTGVQTCALPICPGGAQPARSSRYTARSASLKHTNRTRSTGVGCFTSSRTVSTAIRAACSIGKRYAPVLIEGKAMEWTPCSAASASELT